MAVTERTDDSRFSSGDVVVATVEIPVSDIITGRLDCHFWSTEAGDAASTRLQ